MSIQPKTRPLQALEYIQGYCGPTNPEHLMYISWLNDAEKLLSSDRYAAYTLQGFAHLLMGNIDAALESMQSAYQIKSDGDAAQNYINTLHKAGCFLQSNEISLQSLHRNPYLTGVVPMVIYNSINLLDGDPIIQAVDLYQGSEARDYLLDNSRLALEEIKFRISLLDRLGIGKEAFIKTMQLLQRFLSKHYAGYNEFIVAGEETGFEDVLRIRMFLSGVNIDDTLDWNDLFIDELVESDTLEYDEYKKILVSFIPAQQGARV